MTTDYLKNKILKIPPRPGIYIFKGAENKSLYIGKALNLKNRIKNYLKTDDRRLQKMIAEAKNLQYIKTESEIEALILESQYIKNYRPPFNIMLRDDKQYSFVVFTEEKYPRIITTHQPQNLEKTIGPFTDAGALKTTLRLIRRIFPYCTCKQPHNNYCLNYHIGKCPGFCCLKKPTADKPLWITDLRSRLSTGSQIMTYQKNIRTIKDVLSGKKLSLIKKIEKEMGQLAKKGELEKAIELRNKISDLKRIFENARIIKTSEIIKNYRSQLGSLLKIQKPIIRIEGYDVSNIQGTHATGSMVVFINSIPDKNQYRKFKIKKFKLKITGGNDISMLKEIFERRFKHEEWPFPDLILVDGGKQQLQVAEAVANPKPKILNPKQIQNPKFKIPIIALTKNKKHIGEKIYISGKKNPIALTKLSPADRNLLLQIDSEAHRFAISYYRKLHIKLFK